MRARVLHLGVAGVASALIVGGLLPTAATAAPLDGSRATAVGDTDLSVQVTVDDPTPFVGNPVVFTVRVTNLGPDDMTADSQPDFVLNNLLPASFGFARLVSVAGDVACTTPAVGSTGTVSCDLPTIPATGMTVREIQIEAVAQSAGAASNQATLVDPGADNDTAPGNDTSVVPLNVQPAATEAPDPGDPGDPGYPHGWFRGGGFGGGYGGYDDYDYCDFDCF